MAVASTKSTPGKGNSVTKKIMSIAVEKDECRKYDFEKVGRNDKKEGVIRRKE